MSEKRLEQIQQKANECFPGDRDADKYTGFIFGAMWADRNPAQDVVNLNDVWHSSTEIPTKEGLILYRTTLGRYDVIFQSGNKEGIWKVFVKDYGVAEWAYVNELRPKGGKK